MHFQMNIILFKSKKMKQFTWVVIFVSTLTCSMAQGQYTPKEEGLKILNMVRRNYNLPPLRVNRELSEYAMKKAIQQVNGDSNEIIISRDRVGLLFTKEENASKEDLRYPYRYAAAVIDFIDIDCDKVEKYDLFNQVIDEKSREVGMAEYVDGTTQCIVFVFDNYVYNIETDIESK